MDALSKNLLSAVTSAVNGYISQVASKFDLDEKELLELWSSQTGAEVKQKAAPKKKKTESTEGDKKTCKYQLTKGNTPGAFCPSRVNEASPSGLYCKRHAKHDPAFAEAKDTKKKTDKEAKEKDKPKTKKSSKQEISEESTPVITKMKAEVPSTHVKLINGKYVQIGTGILFEPESKTAYGKEGPNGSIVPLTVEDIQTCKRNGWKYRQPEILQKQEEVDKEEQNEETEEGDGPEEEEISDAEVSEEEQE